MKKIFKILCLTLCLTLVLSACGSNKDGDTDETTQQNLTPAEGGTIKLACFVPDTLNPFATQYQNVRDVLMIVYEGLFKAESTLEATPVLAESYSVSTANKIYTVKLKPNVLFHDGSAMDADDVIATFNYIKQYDTPYSELFKNVLSYKKLDALTVAIELISPQANFAANLDFPILPSGLAAQSFKEDNPYFVPVGTGRFKFDNMVRNKNMTYTKYPEWHGEKKTYVDDIKVSFLHSSKDLFHAFDAGEIDMFTTNGSNWGEFTFTSNHKSFETGSPRYTYIGINTNNDNLKDATVRRDINNAIDKQEMVEEVMFSHATPATLPVISTAYYLEHHNQKTTDAEVPSTGDTETEDIAPSQTSAKHNFTTCLMYNSESDLKKRTAIYLQKKLEPLGINVVLQKFDFEEYKQRILEGNYDMYIGEVVMNNNMNMDFMFSSTQKTSQNLCTYASDEFDNLLVNLDMMSPDAESGEMFFANFVKYFEENYPQIPLFHTNTALFVNSRIKGSITTDMTAFYKDHL